MLPPTLVESGPNAGYTFLNWDQFPFPNADQRPWMQLSVRILTPENVVKYVVIDQGIFDAEEHLRDEDFDLDLFPILPTGDWTTGYVMAVHGRLFLETYNRPLHACSAASNWHQRSVDILSLTFEESLSDAVNRCKDPTTGLDAVVKFARQPAAIRRIESETKVYERLQNTSIGPRFLAHVTENGRTIGFLLEFVQGRRPVLADWPICKTALEALHALGLGHGDMHGGNFIVRGDEVVLIDFGRCGEMTSDDQKQAELDDLQSNLAPDSIYEVVHAERMAERDG